MKTNRSRREPAIAAILSLAATSLAMIAPARGESATEDPPSNAKAPQRRLSHEETLQWIIEHKAWRLARKTRPIWARPVQQGEVGKEFETADHIKETAREGYWLCVGIAGEPWFQAHDKILAKYEPCSEEVKSFGFDAKPQTYRVFQPNENVQNWVAQVKGTDIEGFSIMPGYGAERPIYSPAGGYVVKDHVADPYQDNPKDVWLVQQPLFESTYSVVAGSEENAPRP
jgi:hypothetical protein